MSPIPVIDISPLWTLCDTGKLFIFRIAGQSLRFQSRIEGEMVPCDWLRDGQRFKILKTQNLAAKKNGLLINSYYRASRGPSNFLDKSGRSKI